MAGSMIVLGVIGYVLAGFAFAGAPSITQEIGALLIATNASLFFVAGVLIAALSPVRPASAPAARPRDEYAEWADSLTKPKAP